MILIGGSQLLLSKLESNVISACDDNNAYHRGDPGGEAGQYIRSLIIPEPTVRSAVPAIYTRGNESISEV
jgi:hypothetical protein